MSDLMRLQSIEDLERLLAASAEGPVLIFKHSLSCGISAAAYRRVQAFAASPEGAGAVVALVEVQKAREVAQAIAERTGVRHETPQALVLRGGRAVWHASHGAIRAEALNGALDPAPGPAGGFTLIETLVALSLIGIALLMTMALLALEPRVRRQLEAHQEALRAMETVLEGVRGSSALPADGLVTLPDWVPAPVSASDLRVFVATEKMTERGLYRVTVSASYTALGEGFRQQVETLVWNGG